MTTGANAARRLATLALTALLVAGCGGASAPADSAPELVEQLARVDRAVAAGDEVRIRERVEALASATEAARDDGTLDDEQADRILAAADELLAQLPDEAPAPEPSPTTPTSSPTPEEDEDEEEEPTSEPEEKPDKPEKPEDHGKGKGKGHDDKHD